jgi:hypothetical protein
MPAIALVLGPELKLYRHKGKLDNEHIDNPMHILLAFRVPMDVVKCSG